MKGPRSTKTGPRCVSDRPRSLQDRDGVRRAARWVAVALMASTLPTAVNANRIDDALHTMDSGKLRFEFAARPGVYGDGHSITINSRTYRDDEDCWPYEPGPVRVVLRVRDGRVARLKHTVGGRSRSTPRNTTDLGEVPAQEAATFLMQLARDERSSVAKDAIAAAALADDVELWPQLLELARQGDRSHDVRKSAVFWLGQAASEAVLGNLDEMAMDEDDDMEIRKAAVFAISQRDEDESVPTLIRIARSNAHPKIRRSALFWLSQVDDPRVLEFFEEVLDGR